MQCMAELFWRHCWKARRDVDVAIFEYINGFHNPRRRPQHWTEKAQSLSSGRWHKQANRGGTKAGQVQLEKRPVTPADRSKMVNFCLHARKGHIRSTRLSNCLIIGNLRLFPNISR